MTMELRRENDLREQERLALKRKELDFARDLRSVASRPEGKRLLRRLLEDADLFNPSWTPGETGAYQAGKKAQALNLWRVVRQALPPTASLELLLPPTGATGPTPEDEAEEEANPETTDAEIVW